MKIIIPVFSPPTGTYGNLTRMLVLTKSFQATRHQILFCASGHIAAKLEGKGYRVTQTIAIFGGFGQAQISTGTGKTGTGGRGVICSGCYFSEIELGSSLVTAKTRE